MRRLLKIALYTAAGLAGCALLCALAALIVVQTSWFHEQVRQRMVREIESATGGRVELGGFGFDWHTMTASARGLTVHGTEAAGEAPLFHADLIRAGLKIVSVLEKRVDLQSLSVERPRVNLIVYPDGRTNLPQPKPARKPGRGAIETVLDLAIGHFELTGGTIQAQMQQVPLNLHGENLRVQLGYQSAPARYQGDVSFRSLDVKLQNQPVLPIDVDVRLALYRDRLELQRAHLASHRSTLDASGVVENFAAPVARLAYAGRVDVKEVSEGVRLGPLAHRGTVVLDGKADFSEAAGYAFRGKMAAGGLTFETGGVRIDDIRVQSTYSAARGRLELKELAVLALAGRFDGKGELVSPGDFHAEGAIRGYSLQEMRYIHEVRRVTWNGDVSGPVHLSGEVRKAVLERFSLSALLDIAAAPGDNPVHGLVDLTYNEPAGEVTFGPSNVTTRFSRLAFAGVLGRRLNATAETTNLADAEPAIAMFTAGAPPEMPLKLVNGTARFEGEVVGPLSDPTIEGHAAATNFVWDGKRFDRGEADSTVSGSGVVAKNAVLTKGGLRVSGGVRIGFTDWEPVVSGPLAGKFALRSPSLAEVLAAVNTTAPFEAGSGALTADIVLGGTIGAPEVSAHAQAEAVVLHGQPIDRVQGDARYTPSLLEISGLQLQYGADKARLSGRFEHPAGDWRQGRVQFQMASRGIDLARLKAVTERVPGIEGRVETQMAGEITLAPRGFRPGTLSGEIAVNNLGVNGERLGSLVLSAATQAHEVDVRLDGELAGSKITGLSTWGLDGDYPARGRIDFASFRFSTLLARLRKNQSAEPSPYDGTVSGALEFSGLATDTHTWRVSINMPAFEIRPTAALGAAASSPDLILRNAGPLLLDVDAQGARVRQAHFHAKDTDLTVTGRVGFAAKSPWDVRIQGGMNLALLRDFERRMYSSGALALDVSVKGALDNPEVYGRLGLTNASVNFTDFPNGIENANGSIFLYRDRAIIDTFTAQSGGGKVSVTGFVSLGEVTTFHLRATATSVRVRYPEDISSTMNANLTFTGTMDRSVLSGNATVTRVGLNLRSDLGSILARSAQPVQVPAQPSRFRQGLRFDVHIVTAPQVHLETQLTKDVQADADLRVRGDSTRPVLLGRVLINQGQVNFFGNLYTINSGQILFVNATKIEPNLNLDLETRVRGIDVTLHISGPLDRLNMSYSSDPPLPFSDVLALLTTGREPGLTSGQTASLVGQNYQQGGASTLLSQAIASPITGRLQRFFGVSRLKIDPLVTGMTTSNAAARVTLEQNITKSLTFTYITDLSRAQGQTIRIEWDITGTWSAVAVREENGLFGIDFLYRKQVK